MFPKVLLATPVNIVKSYCLFDWLDHIKQLTYPNIDIFLVDNSRTEKFSKKINNYGIDCVWENPRDRESRYFMASSLERCRTKFLAGDYDYFFSLECDIFPPLTIVEQLMKHQMPVVSGIYFTNQGYKTEFQLLTIKRISDTEYRSRYLTFDESILFIDGQLKPMYANGIGCSLIEREIIETISFRVDPLDLGHADSFFHQDLWKLNLPNMIDTSIILKHLNSDWNTMVNDKGHKNFQLK